MRSKDLRIPVETVDSGRIFPSGIDPDDWFRNGGPEHAHWLGRDVIRRDADRFDPAFLAWIRAALAIPIDEHLGARRRRFRYSREIEVLLAPEAILVTPTLTIPGWSPEGVLPGAARRGLPAWVFNTEHFNLTGHPAMTLPAGRFSEGEASGLPFGIQVVGPRFREGLLFGFAKAWEEARPWPVVAPGYRPVGA